jgi:hypothetical protein
MLNGFDSEGISLSILGNQGRGTSRESILANMEEHVAKWRLPDATEYVAELPHISSGQGQKDGTACCSSIMRSTNWNVRGET